MVHVDERLWPQMQKLYVLAYMSPTITPMLYRPSMGSSFSSHTCICALVRKPPVEPSS